MWLTSSKKNAKNGLQKSWSTEGFWGHRPETEVIFLERAMCHINMKTITYKTSKKRKRKKAFQEVSLEIM